MNGGNVTRGQADGFGLEILGKLKDVKSKDSRITLLHYIVRMYLKSEDNPFDSNLVLPIPQPGDIKRAASVNFDDIKVDLQKLRKQLEGTKNNSLVHLLSLKYPCNTGKCDTIQLNLSRDTFLWICHLNQVEK